MFKTKFNITGTRKTKTPANIFFVIERHIFLVSNSPLEIVLIISIIIKITNITGTIIIAKLIKLLKILIIFKMSISLHTSFTVIIISLPLLKF